MSRFEVNCLEQQASHCSLTFRSCPFVWRQIGWSVPVLRSPRSLSCVATVSYASSTLIVEAFILLIRTATLGWLRSLFVLLRGVAIAGLLVGFSKGLLVRLLVVLLVVVLVLCILLVVMSIFASIGIVVGLLRIFSVASVTGAAMASSPNTSLLCSVPVGWRSLSLPRRLLPFGGMIGLSRHCSATALSPTSVETRALESGCL